MARTARTKTEEPANGGEYKRPDAAKAFKIYDQQIKGTKAEISTLTGDLSQPFADIKKQAHFPRRVLDFIVGLEGMEDAKRDHNLLALAEGLRHRKLFMPNDLVTRAKGEDSGPIVPTGERPKLKLATLPMGVPSDGSESDLADAGEAGDEPAAGADTFTEASDDELAQQEGRGGSNDGEQDPPAEAAE